MAAPKLPAVAFWLYLAALFVALHALGPDLYESDDHYNVRFANLLPSHGVDRTFEWMQKTTLRDHFSDKEFLFHVLLVPFTRSEPGLVTGGKIAAVLFGLGVCAAMLWTLTRIGAPHPMFWTFLLVASSSYFVRMRFALLRSVLLSMTFVAIGFWLHAERRVKWIAALGFVFAWSYSAPHVLVMMSAAWAAAVFVTERRFDWKPLLASALGVAAGLAIHPYTPDSLRVWWQINVNVITMAWSGAPDAVHMGMELAPMPFELWGALLPGTCILAVVGAAVALRRRTTPSLFALFWTAIAFALFTRSARFIEYFTPAAILLAASASVGLDLSRSVKVAALLAALGLHGLTMTQVYLGLRARIDEMPQKVEPLYEAAAWARANLPKGEAIAHVEWDEFGYLYFKNPDHLYVAGLDPTFAWQDDPATWTYLQSLKAADIVSGREIRARLGMRYFLVKAPRLRAALRNDPTVGELHSNAHVSIFELPP